MNDERERLNRTGAVTEAADAIVATLSARLDALLASWQRAIHAEGKATRTENVRPRPAAEVLTELQREIKDLDLRIDKLRQDVGVEKQQAENAEQRAMIAVRENRDDLAKQALMQLSRHSNAVAAEESELIELEAVRGAYQSAVAAVQSSVSGAV